MNKAIVTIVVSSALAACASKTESNNVVRKTEVVNGIAVSTFKVWGNCEMCKETIENSLKVDGVLNSSWNTESKVMTVEYDTTKVSLDKIEKNIAVSGYDTEKYKGDNQAYNELPECCQYDRK